ncbi:cytochrome c-type biogenesis heme exporter protein C [Micromonospora sonchi]|uniref:Heme exporter protein C n=1 Tax=Micromonospora sonchi TaxID=1763543 RepID=A0A917X2X9_9ACTN|nr:cytochrome c biogenesis protein CcsA [Micromonospora sonchi]GGM58414.1 cytochrome c-type biogenesis heme exporter protein C [Micromonospora sonchi]
MMRTSTVELTVDSPPGAVARRTTGWIGAGLAAAAGLAGGLLAPADAVQGPAQRLMYLHVPAAWVAYLAFAVVLVAGGAHLLRADAHWDRIALAATEIGVVLTALTLATGSLWGHLVWGAWWAWDPRLVGTALLFLVYAAALALRRALAERAGVPPHGDPRVTRPVAVVGIGGFLLVPVVHFSVRWWRSLHQQATFLAPERPPADPRMALALLLAVAAASVCATWLLAHRVVRLQRQLDAAGAAGGRRPGRSGPRRPAPVG